MLYFCSLDSKKWGWVAPPVAHPGKCLTIFLFHFKGKTKSIRAPLQKISPDPVCLRWCLVLGLGSSELCLQGHLVCLELPVYPRVLCSPPRPESARGSPHGLGVRRGPTWMRVTFAFIPFCSQFGNSDDCGLGTFSEYSQVCSHKAERG